MKNVPLESTIVGNAVKWTNMQPRCWAMKTHGGMYGKSGIPDVIACINGQFLAGEFKRPKPAGTAVTQLQMKTLNDLAKAGAATGIFRSQSEWQMAVLGLQVAAGMKGMAA